MSAASSQRRTRPSPSAISVLPPTVLGTIEELRTPRGDENLTIRLGYNDPNLTHMKLARRPIDLFDDFPMFLDALKVNKTVRAVELCWRFLSMLGEQARIQLMEHLGNLPALEKLYMEAIGPCDALTVALEKARNLRTLWVGSLRVSSNSDIKRLASAFRANFSLYQVSLSNLKVPARGSHRVDAEGMVWFQEENEGAEMPEKLDLNPLMEALSSIPTLKKIQMELQLNLQKMKRLTENSIRKLCHSPRIYLMVNACGLDDKHCCVLAENLCANTCVLEDLMISRNPGITQQGWKALADMTESNFCLTGLYTPSDPSLAPIAKYRLKMDFYLRLNRAGLRALLSDSNTTREDWIDFLGQESHDIGILFYALQVAPGLFIS